MDQIQYIYKSNLKFILHIIAYKNKYIDNYQLIQNYLIEYHSHNKNLKS